MYIFVFSKPVFSRLTFRVVMYLSALEDKYSENAEWNKTDSVRGFLQSLHIHTNGIRNRNIDIHTNKITSSVHIIQIQIQQL